MQHRVVVTGVGMVSAAGIGIGAAWERLRAEPPRARLLIGPAPAEDVAFHAFEAPPYSLAGLGVPGRSLRWIETDGFTDARDLHHLIAATALGLADAGLGLDCGGQEPPVALVVGDESPGFEQLSRALFRLGGDLPLPAGAEERYALLAPRFYQLNSFLLPHYLARTFRIEGLTLFVNSACTSGLNALEVAAQEVRSGRSRVALAAAADDPLSVAKYLWFRELGLYSGEGVIRPYDCRQQGIVFGDGGAALVLEERESALARGARIYAEYLGAGFAQDGWKIALPSPVLARAADALRRAFAQAGIAAADVDLVVPHGVGTPAADQYESMVLHQVFGGLPRWPAVTALKPLVGHNLGGCALVELALLLAGMARGAVPPTLGHEVPFDRHPLPLVTAWQERRVEIAAKLACGFAGFYGAAVFRRAEF